jgi:hypothetical protein
MREGLRRANEKMARIAPGPGRSRNPIKRSASLKYLYAFLLCAGSRRLYPVELRERYRYHSGPAGLSVEQSRSMFSTGRNCLSTVSGFSVALRNITFQRKSRRSFPRSRRSGIRARASWRRDSGAQMKKWPGSLRAQEEVATQWNVRLLLKYLYAFSLCAGSRRSYPVDYESGTGTTLAHRQPRGNSTACPPLRN